MAMNLLGDFQMIVFYYDSAVVKRFPKTIKAFLKYAKKNKGKITYPAPPDFTGTTFLKRCVV